ncbi:MAG TPA: twin-arginine translocation signal domain-containing protein, partial [Xanthobacteraceae bacterium]|nr:twin-arginine translocation signal domain-containing protein [Xanthobacteraceae bacterium]
MERRRFLAGSALAAAGAALGADALPPFTAARAASGPQPKPPTQFTIDANKKYLALPFDNRADFIDAEKGFIAGLPDGVIVHDGKVVFNANLFAIDDKAEPPATVNPSLWRIC